VSLLDRLQSNRHLDDAALAGIWADATAEREAAGHPHLADCAHCRARYVALASWADGLRTDAHAEADEAFSRERLAAQQSQIFRRLEAMERPARVIAFPRLGRAAISGRSGAQRWIGAAAAAGLLVGLAAGQLLNLPLPLTGGRSRVIETPVTQGAPSVRSTVAPTPVAFSDDELFDEVDARRPPARALEAIDAMTPRTRDLDLPR
jgi:hypothetical protein